MMKKVIGSVAVAAVLIIGAGGSAQAETKVFKDRAGDVKGGVDIQTVRVKHGAERVFVRVNYRDLVRGKTVGTNSVYFDTSTKRRGPEFVLYSTLGDDGQYGGLSQVRNWNTTSRWLDCAYKIRIAYPKDRLLIAMPRRCLGNPETVKVAVSAWQEADGGQVDWAPKNRRLYPAVARD